MEVYARSENLQLFEDGYVGVELQVYYPKPGRNPQDIYDVPDTVLVAVLRQVLIHIRNLSMLSLLPRNLLPYC